MSRESKTGEDSRTDTRIVVHRAGVGAPDEPVFRYQCALVRGETEDPRAERARFLLADGGIISVRALNEFTNVARRNLGQPWGEIKEKLGAVRVLCEVKPLTVATHEDLQHGQQIEGLTIRNPFETERK